MCTLIVGVRLWPALPLVVAANRDEDLDRPAAPPARREHANEPILAPRDLTAGGTWLGLNAHGVFVGLTNRFGLAPDPGRRSRGALVLSVLTHPSARDAFAAARALDPHHENGFHLVVADRTEAYVICSDTEALTARPLAPGWHVVTERSFDAAPTTRESLIRDGIRRWGDEPPTNGQLQDLLSLRHPDGFNGVLVDVPSHNYGTRSSTLIRLFAGRDAHFLHADGRLDATPFVDYGAEVRRLFDEVDGPS